jgi:hypothetical protein
MIGPVTALMALYASIPTPANSQAFLVDSPIPLPGVTGESPLQQTVADAVATMCVHALDGNANLI